MLFPSLKGVTKFEFFVLGYLHNNLFNGVSYRQGVFLITHPSQIPLKH